MDNRLIDFLKNDGVLVTSTQRLSQYIDYHYAKYQLDNAQKTWQTPHCLSWVAWCKQTFKSISIQHDNDHVCLNQSQQLLLWQENIIQRSSYYDQLLQTSATATEAQHAYQLCKEWCIPIFPENVYLSNDAFAFKKWALSYEQYKQKHHLLDDVSLPDYLLSAIKTKKIAFKKIAFYGFDYFTTQQQNLITSLKEVGTEIMPLDSPKRNPSVSICTQDDPLSEFTAAACWAKQQLAQKPTINIGIIALDLSAIRHLIDHAFQSVFDPAHVMQFEKTGTQYYSIAVGKPLLYYPLIHTAMALLSLGKRSVSFNNLSLLLHSPFIKDAKSENIKRANFDAILRAQGEYYWSFKSIYSRYKQYCQKKPNSNAECASFIQLLKSFEALLTDHKKTKSWQQWATDFTEWLKLFGWPGERSLNSEEYQTTMEWHTILTELGNLDLVSTPIDFTTALNKLHQHLSQKNFQPKTDETPIQILGMQGAAGMQFDAIWVLRMQDQHWPENQTSNPLIPKECQRQFKVPMANTESQLKLSEQITEQLKQSTNNIVFSYAKQEGDRPCRPSPLIKSYMKNEQQITPTDQHDFKKTIYASKPKQLEEIVDNTKALMITTASTASGGSGLFKDQAACPFKAFACHRLHAKSLGQIEIGLSAAERGNLAHRALHYFWQTLTNQQDLNKQSEQELEQLIQAAVKKAINAQRLLQPQTFTNRFTRLEQDRLQKTLKQWLEIERERVHDFKVLATEQWEMRVFEGLEINIRIDRIDELADGRCVIIDYKTGTASKSHWLSDRPKEPQLPFYAITNDKQVAAIAFACLKPGELGFTAIADTEGMLSYKQSKQNLDWQGQFANWKMILTQLAKDFRAGKAEVNPTKAACEYCDLHSLCRIYEQKTNLDEQSDQSVD